MGGQSLTLFRPVPLRTLCPMADAFRKCLPRRPGWRCVVLGACLALAGCFETAPLTQAASRVLAPAAGPASTQVLGRAVTVAGPAGYCIDIEATRESDIEAFVLLVRCRGTMRPSPVLTATVTGVAASDDAPALERLLAFVQSAPGRAQLSRSGDPQDLEVIEATVASGAVWMLLNDRDNPDSFDETYWRAVLPVAGRIVTLSVLAAADHPYSRDSGLAILRGFVQRMREVNRD